MKHAVPSILIVVVCCSGLLAQNFKRTNIWYFGRNAGIDFNTIPPTPLLNGALNIWEGCATLCDTSGNLMMYTDGIRIWNKNHQVMPGATNLGGNNSSTQSGIIVPVPNSPNLVYVFSVDSHGGSGGLRFAIVDMTLNAGLGGLLSSNNVLLAKCTEKITAIQHCNKTDFWILAHEMNSNRFVVWELTSAGLNLSATTIPVGTWHGPGSEDVIGYLKGSTDGSKIALGVYGNATSFFEVFDFDNITGSISNPIFLDNPQFVHPYGVEFSPNGKLLYLAGTQNAPILFQYNLALGTPQEVQNSLAIIDYGNSSYYGAIQMGPDGIIYVAKDNSEYLSTINNPNGIGAACNFMEDDFYLGGRLSGVGLPNLIPGYFKKAIKTELQADIDSCKGSAILHANTNASGDSVAYHWYLNGNMLVDKDSTSIQVDSSGEYAFVVQVFSNCQPLPAVDTQNLHLLIPIVSVPETSLTASICAGESFAGYSASGVYVDTLQAATGCDSIRTLQLTVLPLPTSSIAANVCQGERYAGYSASGVYVDTLHAATGCDSIRTLQLTVLTVPTSNIAASVCQGESYAGYSASGVYVDTLQAATGCDSIRTLQLTVLPLPTNKLVASICAGDSYAGYSASGVYVDTLQAATGCDSIRTLQLTVLPLPTSSIVASVCQGESYAGYTAAGVYIDTLQAATGCDSIRTLQLTVLLLPTSNIASSVCQGESFAGYSASGIYVDTLQPATGCDSIRTLQLTVLPLPTSSIAASVCQGESYAGYSASGVYVDTLQAATGCDSIRTLQLTVLPLPTSSIASSVCQGESYAGYSASGAYVDTLQAATGCDSIRTLQLTVLPLPTNNLSVSICQGESYAGYSASGVYVDTLQAAAGCDSIQTLQLTVLPLPTSSLAASVCQGESYAGYSASGVYVDTLQAATGCDSIRTLQLTVLPAASSSQSSSICPGTNFNFNGQNLSNPGIYVDTVSTMQGCDSVVVLTLEVAPARHLGNDTMICIGDRFRLESPSENTIWFDNSTGQFKFVEKSGLYWASFVDANGCAFVDSVVVQFNLELYVPNVFSPNNDGINDCFQPGFSGTDFSVYQLSVYDRWGSLIFLTHAPTDCWEGTFRGDICNPGVYVYLLEVETPHCKKTFMKGNVTLVR